MKNFIIITLLFFTSSLSANELAWVDEQIEAIKPSRSGLNNSSINSVKDPFIFLKKYKKDIEIKKGIKAPVNIINSKGIKVVPKKKRKLILSAIMNKSALISGKWYKLGANVNEYKLKEVNKKSVLLTKKSKTLILSTHSINKKLNFKNK